MAPSLAPAAGRIKVPELRRRENATANEPVPRAATNGLRPRNVSTRAIAAARVHGFMSRDQLSGKVFAVMPGRTATSASPAATAPSPARTSAGGGSGSVTRICGAPHCEQNGLPSSMLCPHLWQEWSIGDSGRTDLKVSHDAPQTQGSRGSHLESRAATTPGPLRCIILPPC